MAKFTIKAGASERLEIACRYMLIDSITNGLQLTVRGQGESSDFEFDVRGGGEISDLDEIVSDWVVHNKNAIDVELVIQYGSVQYRENRIDGDINALTVSKNLTEGGNYYFGGRFALISPSSTAQVGIVNMGSAVIFVDVISVSTPGAVFHLDVLDDVVVSAGYLNWTVIGNFKHNKIKSGSPGGGNIVSGAGNITNSDAASMGSWPCDPNGAPSVYDLYSAPVKLLPGQGLFAKANSSNIDITASFEWHEV